MSRLNKILKQNEELHHKKQRRKKEIIPTYDMNGKTITPEKKKRDNRIAIFLLVMTGILVFIYFPQFFMPGKNIKVDNQKVQIDSTAIRLNNTALRNHPEDDFDGDGLMNAEETSHGTNPWQIDTDHDGVSDFAEINLTKTDPKTKDDTLIDKQTKDDKAKEKKVGSPYKIGNVILWADDYDSKAYGSVVETITGYRFCNFNGYAQFPKKDGKYAYKVENGKRTPLTYRKTENAWKIDSNNVTVELYEKPLEEIIEFNFFSKKIYAASKPVTDIISILLPDKGFIAAEKKMKMDVEVDTRERVVTDIEKPSFNSSDDYRFTVNTNTLNDLLFVREAIKEDQSCVAVSLYNEQAGEYTAIVYGYTYDGNLLLADMNTLKPIGTLSIMETAKKMLNENGSMVSVSYFDFEGFGFSSLNGDRISFFAASSSEVGKNSNFGDKVEKNKENEKGNTDKELKNEEFKADADNPQITESEVESNNAPSEETNQSLALE